MHTGDLESEGCLQCRESGGGPPGKILNEEAAGGAGGTACKEGSWQEDNAIHAKA